MATVKDVRENYSFAPPGLVTSHFLPTARTVGCILSPLYG